VVAELSVLVENEHFRCPAGIEKPGQLSSRIPNDRERVPVILRVDPDLVPGLRAVAVDGDEEDSFRPVQGGEIAESVVVVVRIRTERRPEDHDDRPMIALRLVRGKRVALYGCPREGRNGGSDLECGRAGREQERDKRGAGELADETYSAEASADADFRAKLRITRFGEKPQLNPTASPGWTA
jgi:hypothetical protein